MVAVQLEREGLFGKVVRCRACKDTEVGGTRETDQSFPILLGI